MDEFHGAAIAALTPISSPCSQMLVKKYCAPRQIACVTSCLRAPTVGCNIGAHRYRMRVSTTWQTSHPCSRYHRLVTTDQLKRSYLLNRHINIRIRQAIPIITIKEFYWAYRGRSDFPIECSTSRMNRRFPMLQTDNEASLILQIRYLFCKIVQAQLF
eukprot:4290737-Pleurochrysis_carterae.AAC.1